MAPTQDKYSDPSEEHFQRLKRLQLSENLTWRQVADALHISVSAIMAIKGGRRRLGDKVLYRLESIEREIAERKSQAELVVDRLLAGQGMASQVVDDGLGEKAKAGIPIEYSNPRASRRLPKTVTFSKPREESCAKLRQLFGETLDTRVVLLACLPDPLRSEGFLAKLTADSRIRLTNLALNLVFPEWRILAAKSAGEPKHAEGAAT